MVTRWAARWVSSLRHREIGIALRVHRVTAVGRRRSRRRSRPPPTSPGSATGRTAASTPPPAARPRSGVMKRRHLRVPPRRSIRLASSIAGPRQLALGLDQPDHRAAEVGEHGRDVVGAPTARSSRRSQPATRLAQSPLGIARAARVRAAIRPWTRAGAARAPRGSRSGGPVRARPRGAPRSLARLFAGAGERLGEREPGRRGRLIGAASTSALGEQGPPPASGRLLLERDQTEVVTGHRHRSGCARLLGERALGLARRRAPPASRPASQQDERCAHQQMDLETLQSHARRSRRVPRSRSSSARVVIARRRRRRRPRRCPAPVGEVGRPSALRSLPRRRSTRP